MNWVVVVYQCSYPDFDGCALPFRKYTLKYVGVIRHPVYSGKTRMCIYRYICMYLCVCM